MGKLTAASLVLITVTNPVISPINSSVLRLSASRVAILIKAKITRSVTYIGFQFVLVLFGLRFNEVD